MPEDAAAPVTTMPAPVDPSAVPESGAESSLDLGITVLFVVIASLVIVQNLWLRRRGENEDDEEEI